MKRAAQVAIADMARNPEAAPALAFAANTSGTSFPNMMISTTGGATYTTASSVT